MYRSFAPDEPHVLRNPTPASILGAVLAYGFPYVVPCSLNMPADVAGRYCGLHC